MSTPEDRPRSEFELLVEDLRERKRQQNADAVIAKGMAMMRSGEITPADMTKLYAHRLRLGGSR
jgi:hypothetical protein